MQKYTVKKYFKSFSRIERLIATALFYVMMFSGISVAYNIYKDNTKLINVPGGVYIEGTVDKIEYIDPINAKTPVEKEISHLVFRGLVRFNPRTEEFESDLAKSWSVSEDGLVYTFILKKGVKFHNGQIVTIDDVVDTYSLATNKPYAEINVQKMDEHTVQFMIPERDAFFIKNFSLGIIPVSILSEDDPWGSLKADSFARKPIGSGVFEVKEVVHKLGEDTVTLRPTIESRTKELKIRAFKDTEHMMSQLKYLSAIRSVAAEQRIELQKKGWELHNLQVPRYAVLFFDNITQGPTSDPKFRLGLKYAINKEKVVEQLPHTEVMNFPISYFDSQVISYNKERAASLLYESGWGVYEDDETGLRRDANRNPLALDIITTQNIDFIKAAREIKTQLEDLGITINIKPLTQDEILEEVIQTRDFQILLLGQDIGLDEDFRFYLHSTQSQFPGLNISQFKNTEADVLLSKIAESYTKEERIEHLKRLQEIINEQVPLAFLFRTFDVYATSPTTHATFAEKIGSLEYRFMNFPEWMIKTKRVSK